MRSIAGVVVTLVAALCSAAAQSQEYPARPVRIVAPFAAGGSGDVTARLVADYFGKRWNQSVIVENRAGGGGLIGSNEVKRAAPDGHTLLMGYDALTSFSLFVKDNTFDAAKDLAPISLLVRYPLALLSTASLPAKSLPELISYIKANPGKVNFGIITNAPGHLYGLVLGLKAGIDYTMIPYASAAALTAAMISGESHLTLSLYGSFVPSIRDGKVNALAVAAPARLKQAPNVPTFREGGVDINAAVWYALFAPAATPAPVLAKVSAAAMEWSKQPSVIETADKLAMELVGSTPAELAKVVADDTVARAEAARLGKIQPQ